MRASKWIVPVAIFAATIAGLWGARLLAAPSLVVDYGEAASAGVETTRLKVQGVRCVDTGQVMANQLKGTPGVLRCIIYASQNEALVTYDPARCSPDGLRDAIEGPVFDETSGEIQFHVFQVLSVDGNDVDPGSDR